jgi:hypothetical protein
MNQIKVRQKNPNNKLKMKFFSLILILFFFGCEQENNVQFENKISNLIDELSSKQVKQIVGISEEKALYLNYNDSTIITKVLHEKTDSTLIVFFNSEGISNEKDIKIIILNSLYRKVNNKPINLEDQIKSKLEVYKLDDECEKLITLKIIKSFKYEIGDTIQIRFKIFGDRGAYQTICELGYPDWIFDDKKDMLVKGVVCKKYLSDTEESPLMKIIIDKINKEYTTLNGKMYKVNDTLELSLEYAILEDIASDAKFSDIAK